MSNALNTLPFLQLLGTCGCGKRKDECLSFAVLLICFDRNCETTQLQYKHLTFGCLSDGFKIPYWMVQLTGRKGWQRHMSATREVPLEGE